MNRYGAGGAHSSRGKAVLMIVLAGAFLAAWVILFALYGGGGGQASEGGPAAGETTSGAAEPPSGEKTQTAVPGEPVSRLEDGEDGGPGDGRRGGKTSPGAKNEPGGYDPLGTGAEPGDLSETEEGRVTMAATNFVLKAYGYSGDEEKEYTGPLNRYIFPWSFYESPAGATIKDYRRRIGSGGVQSSAVMERFEIKETSLEEAKGVAHFVVEDDFGKRKLTQELTLKPYEAVWRVAQGGDVEQKD